MVLSALNKQWSEANFDDQLGVYLKALVANVPEGKTAAPAAIAPQFELAFSGWYWQITRTDVNPPEIRASKSLFATQLPQLVAVGNDHGAILSGYAVGPGGHQLRMIQREIDAGDDGRFLVQVAANADVIQAQERSFETALAATFLTLALALIGSTALAVRFGLRPLRVLREGVAAIRRGEAEHIEGEFPHDVAPLATEVNQLIDANREIVERARTQVGNLAHALKTPLSVLMNEADLMSPALPEKVREQTEIMRRQVTFYLDRARAAARARTFGVATEVKPVVEGLVRTYEKLHGDQVLTFDVALQPGLKVSGRSAGPHRSHRKPPRQCRKVGARTGLHSRRPRRGRKGFRSSFLSPRLTTMGRASTRTLAPRRSNGESGLTSCGPARGLAFRSSSSSPRFTVARSSSTKARSAACGRSCGSHASEPRLCIPSSYDP